MHSQALTSHRRSKAEGVLVALMFAGVGLGGVVYGARTWMPELASRHGAGIDAMLHYPLVTVAPALPPGG